MSYYFQFLFCVQGVKYLLKINSITNKIKKKTSILYTERIIYLLKVNLETLEQGVKYI